MSQPAEEATGLMLLRVWTESGGQTRVRVTRTTGLGAGRTTSYACSTPEVLHLVGTWLDELVTSR